MPGLIAYTGIMPAKRKGARGRFEMVLSPEDELILVAIEERLRLNRTAVVRLALSRLASAEGVSLQDVRDALAKQSTEGAE